MFPSPIGELHFSILDIRETERVEYTVSVPYRGATFLNIFCKYVKNTDYRVSVPYRGATFLNCEHGPDIKSVGGFRPLSGSYISQFVFNEASGIQTATVSVPYRGATFLNSIFRFYKRATDSFPSPIGELHFSISLSLFSFIISQFPSPIGELHFSMLSVNPKNELLFAFPSPIGELHFSIDMRKFVGMMSRRFPSPIGELHFSIIMAKTFDSTRIVSVPYRGATFLNKVQDMRKNVEQFPSPIGELHFSIFLKQ